MLDPLRSSVLAASSGLAAQSRRLQVVSENLANANSTSNQPGGTPYSRKIITFEAVVDEAESPAVKVGETGRDPRPFRLELDPGHPAADEKGYVKYPNVNAIVELADMRESNRMYEANLQVMRQARELTSTTIDLLKATS